MLAPEPAYIGLVLVLVVGTIVAAIGIAAYVVIGLAQLLYEGIVALVRWHRERREREAALSRSRP